jgi:hypothetical protein
VNVTEFTFKTEIEEVKEIFAEHGFYDEENEGIRLDEVQALERDLDAFFEQLNEASQNYVKENRGEFGLRSESDSPVGV